MLNIVLINCSLILHFSANFEVLCEILALLVDLPLSLYVNVESAISRIRDINYKN